MAESPKVLGASVAPVVAWFDLTTTDLPRSRAFYAELFGWSFGAVEGTTDALAIHFGGATGQDIGTLRLAEGGPIAKGNGLVYIEVADATATYRRALALGATVDQDVWPVDLPAGRGAIAVFTDPVGHPIGIYSRRPTTR
jgi:predicted enzyme related to lactoylglutathione lyase